MNKICCVNMYLIISNEVQQQQFETFFKNYQGSIPNPEINPICLKIEEKK